MDSLENVAPDALDGALRVATGAISSITCLTAIVIGGIAAAFTKHVTSYLFNAEGTKGFREHILREGDACELTQIIINGDNTITFRSAFGDSNAVISSSPVAECVKNRKTMEC